METNQAAWPLRVLVVDDDRDMADSLALLLKMWGHCPLVAYRSVDAFRLSLDQRPEVVLLDIGLPGIDGYEVARRVRRQSGMAGVFLIAVTGYGAPGDHELARKAGFDLHLLKPVEPEELREALAGARARLGDTAAPVGREASPAAPAGNALAFTEQRAYDINSIEI